MGFILRVVICDNTRITENCANYSEDLLTVHIFANLCGPRFSYTKASHKSAFSYDISSASLSRGYLCFCIWNLSNVLQKNNIQLFRQIVYEAAIF